jgi:hypothetical protein
MPVLGDIMDKETERRIALLHALAGLGVGVGMGLYYRVEGLTILSVIIIGVILSSPLLLVTRKLFSLAPEEFQPKDWLGKGFFNFFLIWIVTWVFVFNLM